MKILIACEYSGIVRDAFAAKGWDAWSCDIIPTEGNPAKHYCGDVFDIIDGDWDMMIAHPPCTYLSNAGARHLYPKGVLNKERYDKGIVAKDFFMRLYNAKIPHICVENPVPSKIYNLPPYSQIIQPYYFGEPIMKATCLRLKNLPKLTSTKVLHKPQSTKIAGNWFNKGGKDRQKNRAKFFIGVAEAMAEQWIEFVGENNE
jgi:hypothetical protein